MGFFDRLRDGLTRTKQQIVDRFDEIVQREDARGPEAKEIDVDTVEALEELLLSADVGVAATEQIVTAVRARARRGESLRELVKTEIRSIFDAVDGAPSLNGHAPHVTLIVGVNGTGKTTTIGKLANLLKASGKQPLVCAADTFRAAAVEQLAEWGRRHDVTVVAQEKGDSAAVIFDAISSARAKGIDVVLADTAGRLPTQLHLMDEIRKVKRVMAKADPTAPHETLLVLDANTGQNAVRQVKAFDEALGLTGLVVTKLDGTAKGGAVAAIAREHPVPIRFIGIGEKAGDLRAFVAADFVDALFA